MNQNDPRVVMKIIPARNKDANPEYRVGCRGGIGP